MGDSRSYGVEKRLAGKEYRSGTLGDAISDMMDDTDDGFVAIEAEVDVSSDLQRMGNLGGGMLGAASAWKLSDEATDPLGHGFGLDVTGGGGAFIQEVLVTDVNRALATTIPLTVAMFNAAILAQCTGANALARLVYDNIAGAYRIVLPEGTDASSIAISAPAAANDVSGAGDLEFAAGSVFARIGRAAIDALTTTGPTMASVGEISAVIGTPAATRALDDTLLRYIETLGIGVASTITVNTGAVAKGAGVFTTLGLTGNVSPYAFRITGVRVACAAANALGTVQLRDTAAGGGAAITDAIPCAVLGNFGYLGNTPGLASLDVAAGAEIYWWKNAIADSGRIFIDIVRTA